MKKYILPILLLVVTLLDAQSSKNLTLLGSIQYAGQTLAGCWHYNKPGGGEYALVGTENGISIVDITVPSIPMIVNQVPGVTNLWHEIKVIGDYAYAVSEGADSTGVKNGMQIINLSYLPDSAPYKFYQGDGIIANQLVTSHSITAEGQYVYLNGHNIVSLGRGVIILNISNPWNPAYVGAITNRYCHDSYVRNSLIFTSDIIDGIFSVYNIANPAAPVLLATQPTPGQFNHNTWLSDDGATLFAADERNGVPLASFDISDLNNITLIDTFYNGNFPLNEVHNVRVKNNFLLNASYGSQLTIVDAAHPNNLIEVGNYTTGNSLCWDADPFLNSGNIIATDMNSGTFYIFSPEYIRACYLEGIVRDSLTGLPLNNVNVLFTALNITRITDGLGEYRTGYADSGSYTVEFSKTGYLTKLVTVNLQNASLTSLNVELVPIGATIKEVSENEINIFPNPSAGMIKIASGKSKIDSWKLNDLTGKIVMQSPLDFNPSYSCSVNLEKIPPAMYFLKLSSGNQIQVKSVVKY